MASRLSVDFLIIGAGVAGLSLARELSEFAQVAVLDMEVSPGFHASGRSAAIFVDSYGDHVVQELSAASRRLLESPPFEIDQPLLSPPRGILYVARPHSVALPASDHRRQFPVLTGSDARAMVPILRETAIDYAHWEAQAADIDVHALLTALQRRIRARGGKILFATAVSGARRTGGVWTVTAGTATVSAPVLVNAAGAWAADVGVLIGARRLPLMPCRRTEATIAPPVKADVASWPMVVDIEETIYFKPDAGALMLSPADEEPVVAHDAFADDLQVAIAVDRFEALTNHSVQRVLSRWAGLRTLAPDRRPVTGYDSSIEGLFWLAAQGGFGIQTALGTAALGRSLITGDVGRLTVDHPDLARLISPARFTPITAFDQSADHSSRVFTTLDNKALY